MTVQFDGPSGHRAEMKDNRVHAGREDLSLCFVDSHGKDVRSMRLVAVSQGTGATVPKAGLASGVA